MNIREMQKIFYLDKEKNPARYIQIDTPIEPLHVKL